MELVVMPLLRPNYGIVSLSLYDLLEMAHFFGPGKRQTINSRLCGRIDG